MMWLLDTNVLSELRPGKPHASSAVRQWAANVPIGRQFISAVTLAELETGILRLEHQSPPQGQALRRWYEGIVTLFRERTLVIDSVVAHHYARLQAQGPRPVNDTWIAAIALAHGMTVVTRNTKDFSHGGVRTLDPWAST